MSNTIRKFFLKLRKDERGATLVEYGVALLIAVIVGGSALIAVANSTSSNFQDAANTITEIRSNIPTDGGGGDTGGDTGGGTTQ